MKPLRANPITSLAAALTLTIVCAAASPSPRATARPAYAPVMADAPAIKKAIAANLGHVVVVNFWATWCGPCVEEFPSLVRLHDRYAHCGLVVMSVSADQGKMYVSQVAPFLAKQKADFPAFILKGDQEKAMDAFDPTWQGDLPRTFVYDKQGRLVKTLTDEQTYAQFEKAVEGLL